MAAIAAPAAAALVVVRIQQSGKHFPEIDMFLFTLTPYCLAVVNVPSQAR